ncbi:putative cytochrome P450 49a1 [Armadillidium vulgare]|nr:putative cytochrome P450 49a1 [Armadillidium vulgare]
MPSLKSYPLIGSSLALMRHKDFDRERIYKVFLSFFRDYGKIFKVNFPGQPPLVFISKPEDIEHLHRATTNNPVRQFFFSLKHVRDNNPYFENNSGLLTENHEKWRRVRSRVQTPLLRPKNLLKYLPEMDQTSKDFLEIIASYQRRLGEMPEHFLNDLNKWALESVALVALNTRLGCLKSDLPEDSMQVQMINNADKMLKAMRVTELGLPLWKIFATPSYKKLKYSHDAFLSFADENIRKAEKDLMVKKSSNNEAEMTLMETLLNTEGLTRKDVVTMILDMLFGGIDTTSHTVAFTLYLLAKNPDKQKKLQLEIDEVLGDGKQTLSENHLARLSYLKCCVKEALRIYPYIGTGRELEKDEVFSGFLVLKGILFRTFNLATTMNEENFQTRQKSSFQKDGRETLPLDQSILMPLSLFLMDRECASEEGSQNKKFTHSWQE